ncbi:MAG TPA: ubiquinone biosynthesis regulatory protein kinase UbiB [Marinagarivorans sp.]|nr:ubiquinone biosynthesis regulatory protein kinase UbiB [Marinagarivorans sp.]HNG58878.1 ubiquinone biosynthesis regulatory protein kinase UbiB [Cellvibrionaceae bacterium]
MFESSQRLLTILRVFARYQLLELLPEEYQKPWLKLLFACFKRDALKLPRGERLRLACQDLGPIFVKFGQLLSTRPDLIPPDICLSLNQLQDRVAPFPSEQFVALVEEALGQPVAVLFSEFSLEPLASASIAQVHCARLHSGEQVVIKAVRPGIESTIHSDLSLMLVLARWIAALNSDGKRLKPVEVVEEYRNTILDELDLMREAANAAQLKRNFTPPSQLYVPKMYWDYCRTNVLVMERIWGVQVTDIKGITAAGVDLKTLAELGVEIFFTQVFDHNFFHADMHPGNVYVSTNNPRSPHYIALDMAIMGSLTREDQYYLARNLLAMFRRDYRQVAELHVVSNWVPKNTSVAAFESAIRSVCEPIFAKPLKDISFGQALISLFQTARRFNMEIQPQLVLLQKTLLNIEGLGRQLYPELDLWATAHPFLERWVQRRYHPKTLWKELKRQAPDWLEQLPTLPQLSLDALHSAKTLAAIAPDVQALARSLEQRERRRPWRAAAAVLCALSFTALALRFGGGFGLGDWLVLCLGFLGVMLAIISR